MKVTNMVTKKLGSLIPLTPILSSVLVLHLGPSYSLNRSDFHLRLRISLVLRISIEFFSLLFTFSTSLLSK